MRTEKAKLNILTSFLYQIVATVCSLIAPRLILATFGSTYNGVIQSATQLLSMISLLTLGVAGATRVALYKTLAAGDIVATSRVVKANRRYMNKVGIALIFYVIGLAAIYPLASHNDLSYFENVGIVLIVSISCFAEYFFGITYATLLTADQRSYVTSLTMTAVKILNCVVIYVLIRCGCSIYVVYFFATVAFALAPIFYCVYANRKYKLLHDCEPDDAALEQKKAAAFHSLANIIHTNTDVALLTLFADAKVISVYSVYFMVTGKMRMIMQVFTGGMEAAFGNMWAKNEEDAFNRYFSAYEFVLYSFVSVVFGCAVCLIVPFVRLYTRGVTDINYINWTFAILITAAEGLYCIREPYLTLVQATGNYDSTKKYAITEAIINVVSSLILVNLLGLIGVVIGTIIANTYRTVNYIIFVYRRLLRDGARRVLARWLVLLGNIAVIVLTFRLLQSCIDVTGWLTWVLLAVLMLAVSLTVTVLSGFLCFRSDFKETFRFAKRAIHKA